MDFDSSVSARTTREVGRYLREGARYLPVALAAWLVVEATNLVDFRYERFAIRPLDANWGYSWSHDADTLLVAIGALITLVCARRPTPRRRAWYGLAVILVALLLDEASPLHAEIGHVSKLLYAPILLGMVAAAWYLADRAGERPVVAVSVATLLISFTMHVVGLTLLRPIGYMSWPYQIGVGVKEGCELGGLLLLVLALSRMAAWEGRRTGAAAF